jgi:hypothetical protein
MRSKCHKSSSLDAKNVESSDTPQWIAVPRNADPPVFNELPYWWVARSLAGAMHSQCTPTPVRDEGTCLRSAQR